MSSGDHGFRLFASTERGDRARDIATKAHEGQVDTAGMPYIDHPRRVGERLAQVDGVPEAGERA